MSYIRLPSILILFIIWFYSNGIHDANYSIINVNFASESVKVYDQSPLFAWYELLGRVFADEEYDFFVY